MALKEIGNRIVLKGTGKFIADLSSVNRAMDKTNKKIAEQVQAAAKSTMPNPAPAMEKQIQQTAAKISAIFQQLRPAIQKALEALFGASTARRFMAFGEQYGDAFIKAFTRVMQRKPGGDDPATALFKNLDLSKLSSHFSQASNAVQNTLGKLGEAFGSLGTKTKLAVLGIGMVVAALVVLPVIAGAVSKAFAAFNQLGQRGAQIEGLAMAFDHAAERAGLSSATMLQEMRKASVGMVSDIELIKRSNLALAGATGKVASEMGKNLPELLKIARAQARATGQDVNYLFESLTTGIKRSSPMLIDNTGLVLKIGEANEAMAQKLGKSVEALTAEEKQLAVLFATLDAGKSSVEALGNAELTAAEISQQTLASRENMMNSLAASIQPLYKKILEIGLAIQQAMTGVAQAIAPIIYVVSQLLGAIIDEFMWFAGGLYKVFVAPILNELRYVIAGVVVFVQGLKILMGIALAPFHWLADSIGKAMRWVGEKLVEIFPFLEYFKKGLFRGAAAVFGAFAAGILHALNKYIYPAVIAVAKAIADFLIGESPPPMGPLSQIDKGGANVMEAWMSGFAGVSLEPVARVAQSVIDRLGPVAFMALDQVNARLGQLDQQLQPFKDSLALVNARLEAMTAPFEKVKNIVAKRLDAAVKLMTQSGMGAEQVRALDKQMEFINQRLNAANDERETAELQLALAQARQAEERAALQIRQSMLGVTEKIAAQEERILTDSPVHDAVDAIAKTAGGGGAGSPMESAAGSEMPGGGGGSIMDAFTGMDGVKQAAAELKASFMEGFADAGGTMQLAAARGNQTELATQVGRIKQGVGDLSAKLGMTFDKLKGQLKAKFEEIQATFDGIFGPEGTLSGLLFGEESIFNRITTALTGEDGLLPRITGAFAAAFDGSLAGSVTQILGLAESTMSFYVRQLGNTFTSIFTSTDGPIQTLATTLQTVMDNLTTILREFATGTGVSSIKNALSLLIVTLTTALRQPFVSVLQGIANALARAINGMIQAIVNGFEDAKVGFLLPGDIKNLVVDAPQIFHKGGKVKGSVPEGMAWLQRGEAVLSLSQTRAIEGLSRVLARPSYNIPIIDRSGGNQTNINRGNTFEEGSIHIVNNLPTDTTTSVVKMRRQMIMAGM